MAYSITRETDVLRSLSPNFALYKVNGEISPVTKF